MSPLRRLTPLFILALLLFVFYKIPSSHNQAPTHHGPTHNTQEDTPSTLPENSPLYVSAEGGKDFNPGTAQEPLASLHQAVERARELKRMGRRVFPFEIILMNGVHQISKTIEFSELDSGTAEAPLIIRGESQKGAILSGGVDLDPRDFKTLEEADLTIFPFDKKEDLYKIDLSSFGVFFETEEIFQNTGFGFPVLPGRPEVYFNGEPMRLARFPNEGYLMTGAVAHPGDLLEEGFDPQNLKGITGAQFKPEGIPRENILLWENQKNIWAFGYWQFDWAEQASRVEKISTDHLHLVGPTAYGVTNGSRYYLFNIPQELDFPGEYFIDYEKRTLYLYPPTPITDSTKIQVSWMKDPMMSFKQASYIRVEKVTMETSRGSGIQIIGGTNVALNFLVLRNFGNAAVVFGEGEGRNVVGAIGGSKFDRNFYDTMWFRDAGNHHSLSHSKIYNIGAMGVILGGGDRKDLSKGMNKIMNCDIHHFARIYTTYRPGIFLDGVGNVVENTRIHHAPHSGIICFGNEHLIRGNELDNLILDTSDAGLIYIGRDFTARGIKIQKNLLHHSQTSLRDGTGAQGVYLDDQASGVAVTGNIFYRIDWAFVLGGGRDVIFRNNLVLYCNRTLRADARGLKEKYSKHLQPNGDLIIRYQAAPITSPIWIKTYPELQALLSRHPELPVANQIQENVFYASKAFSRRSLVIHEKVVENGEVGANWIGGDEKEISFEEIDAREMTQDQKLIERVLDSKDRKQLPSLLKEKFSEILKTELPSFSLEDLWTPPK